jgi:glycosyltransferase involved in cell wall biosynthesis
MNHLSSSLSPLPLVSVITPTYNRSEYLKQAIASALAQTYQNIEIIVSDNGSPTDPRAIVEAFDDPRIRFFRHGSNLGMIANTLYTFQQAQGKYVACLLDDDLWEPEFLAKLVPPLEANPDVVLAFCDHYIINAMGEVDEIATHQCSETYKRAHLAPGIHQPFYQLAMIDGAVPTATSAVMRRSLVDWQHIPLGVGGSWDSYLRYLYCCDGQGAYYIPARLTRYRDHEMTDTAQSGWRDAESKIRKARAEVFCCQRFLEDERLQEFHSYFQQKLAHWITTLGIGLMRDQRVKEARPYFWQSLAHRYHWRTAIALLISYFPAVARRF